MLTRLNTGPLPAIATKLQHLALSQIDHTTGSVRSAMRGPPPALAGFVDLDTRSWTCSSSLRQWWGVSHWSCNRWQREAQPSCFGQRVQRSLEYNFRVIFLERCFLLIYKCLQYRLRRNKGWRKQGSLLPVGIVFLHIANNKKCNSSLWFVFFIYTFLWVVSPQHP